MYLKGLDYIYYEDMKTPFPANWIKMPQQSLFQRIFKVAIHASYF